MVRTKLASPGLPTPLPSEESVRGSDRPAFINCSKSGLDQPRYGEKVSYYPAVCLETGEVEWMELEGNSNSETSAAFLDRLRKKHSGPLARIHRNEGV